MQSGSGRFKLHERKKTVSQPEPHWAQTHDHFLPLLLLLLQSAARFTQFISLLVRLRLFVKPDSEKTIVTHRLEHVQVISLSEGSAGYITNPHELSELVTHICS